MVDKIPIFGRTARTRSKEPMQPAHTFLTALARFAQCTGFYERCSRPSSSDGAGTTLSIMAAMSTISLGLICNHGACNPKLLYFFAHA